MLPLTSLFAFGALLLLNDQVEGRSTGAPFGSCLTLTPQHGSQPSQPPMSSPFAINATKVFDETFGTEKVHLVVSSPVKGTPFKGFVLQARYANNPDVIVDGQFSPNEGIHSRTYVCKPGEDMKRNNTWTHRSNQDKSQVTAIWTPPEDFSETVIFVGTIVKDKATFWEHQHSAPLQMGSLVGLEEGETMKPETGGDDHGEMTTDAGGDHHQPMTKMGNTSEKRDGTPTTTAMSNAMMKGDPSMTNFTEGDKASIKASKSSSAGRLTISSSVVVSAGLLGAALFALL